MAIYLIVAEYSASRTAGVDISLKVASKDTIPDEVKGLIDNFMDIVKESGAPISDHMNIMLGLIYSAGFAMEGIEFKEFKEGEEIIGWGLRFHGA
jgi:hypothetical protein